jgi:hypothetical protein
MRAKPYEERDMAQKTPGACGRSVGRAAHQRPEYQVPAEHDGTQSLDLDPLRQIESHEGFVTAHARLRGGSSLYPAWSNSRSWTAIAR